MVALFDEDWRVPLWVAAYDLLGART